MLRCHLVFVTPSTISETKFYIHFIFTVMTSFYSPIPKWMGINGIFPPDSLGLFYNQTWVKVMGLYTRCIQFHKISFWEVWVNRKHQWVGLQSLRKDHSVQRTTAFRSWLIPLCGHRLPPPTHRERTSTGLTQGVQSIVLQNQTFDECRITFCIKSFEKM